MIMSEQYRNFAPSLKPVENRLFEILGIEPAGDELKIILGTSEPRLFSKCVLFHGVTDFINEPQSEGDTGALPQTFFSLDYVEVSGSDELYHWVLMGDECEWLFTASYPEVVNCESKTAI